MDARDDYLHWNLRGHVLFSALPLYSFSTLLAASLLTAIICSSERLLTFGFERHWTPSFVGCSRFSQALWRAALYAILSFLRLAYMLIAMSFHLWLLLVIVFTLASAQFLSELYSSSHSYDRNEAEEPLLANSGVDSLSRPRSKSKPDSIFIHPNHSNIARADAVAMELGLSSSTPGTPNVGHNGRANHVRRDSRQPFDLGDADSDSN